MTHTERPIDLNNLTPKNPQPTPQKAPDTSPGAGLGSPTRAQELDSVDAAARWVEASGIPVHPPKAIRAWLDGLGVPVPFGIHTLLAGIRRGVIATGDVAYKAGFAAAVAMLRDDARYTNWWTALPEQDPAYGYWQQPARKHLADYLETVGLSISERGA